MSEAMLSTDGHVFLDVSRPYVAWATYRGVLITPSNERTSTERFLSWWQTDLHRNSPFIRREAALDQKKSAIADLASSLVEAPEDNVRRLYTPISTHPSLCQTLSSLDSV